MEEDFRARLLADEAINVAAKVAGRIDWGLRPARDTLPAITLTIASETANFTYKGRSGLTRTRIQVDIWGATYAQLVAIKRRLPAVVEPAAQIGATRFDASFTTINASAGAEEMAGGGVAQRHIMEFTVWHRPAA